MPKKQPAKPAATQQASNTTPSQPTSTSTTTTAPTPAADSKSEPASISSEVKNASESLVTGAELENSINSIVGMGFSRELVVAAMKEAFNNPARAVELLTSGFQIPTQTETHTTQTNPAPARAQTPSQPAAHPPASGGGGSGVFDGLKQHPQFPMLCMLAQQGGQEALRQILEYFRQVSPPLLQLIVQNQQEFIQLLSTPVGGAEQVDATRLSQQPTSQATPPGVVRLTITPEDERAIMNIVSMGFDRNRVVEAYFLFEKDEAQTINYLLNNPESDN